MLKESLFPDPTPYDDVVALSHSISEPLLLEAYRKGFFPWPHDGIDGIPWFHPRKRAVLFFEELIINDSLRKAARRSCSELHFTLNKNFSAVLTECAEIPRPDQDGTWITPEIEAEYQNLHNKGHAHSVEAWNLDGKLVGGIYGVYTGGFFAAESMFYHEPNASKLCLLQLIRLLKERGEHLLDIQILTPHMEKLGARELKRPAFLQEYARRKFPPRDRLFESENPVSHSLASL